MMFGDSGLLFITMFVFLISVIFYFGIEAVIKRFKKWRKE